MTITAKDLYEEISRDYKPNKKRPELGEFCELRLDSKNNFVYFTIGWYNIFEVQFNPKTVKVKYTSTNRSTKEKKTITKQISLETENLLDVILSMHTS